ncbi:unnamed protein product [Nesidiocoris tenuis]|uniref:G-patch domain-containing protein n=1 Tax=Nesidiocoris tenuis TaxID=355587 RepID=A0A6H5G8J0_9HEMI|nr:unnamed protein product [Nesidiocoris tenuis]
MEVPKKIVFGFSKVVKKPLLLTPQPVEEVEYIKCVEDKAVKLVNEELVKPEPLPIIPMPKGSSVRDRILDAIKAREVAKSKDELGAENRRQITDKEADGPSGSTNGESKALTLDELAAKELIEGSTSSGEKKKEDIVIPKSEGIEANRELSTLDDYENMPISDYGQAMLRGMGWDPKKGIGLNEKVVVQNIPQVRPKGMGLGADKAMATQNAKSRSDEAAVMKRGSMVKVIRGPHSQLYGKVEAFEELPGRILVRLALGNEIISMGEFMVQLVPLSEYSKNAKVMNLEKYNAALERGNNVGKIREFKKEREHIMEPVVKKERDFGKEREIKKKHYYDHKSDKSHNLESRPNRDSKYSKSKDGSSRQYSRFENSPSLGDDDVRIKSRRCDSLEQRSRKDQYKVGDYLDSDGDKKKKKKNKKERKEKKFQRKSSPEVSSDDETRHGRKRDKNQDKEWLKVSRHKNSVSDSDSSTDYHKNKKCKKSRK